MFKIKSVSPLLIAVSLLGYASSGVALEIIANEGIYKVSNAGSHIPTSTALGINPDDWACTYDNNTKLIWEVKTSDGGLRDIKWNYSWLMTNPALNGGFAGVANGGNCLGGKSCDTQNYVRQVNAEGLCGANDWRMPTQEELNTLSFNHGSLVQNVQNTDKTKGFWSSSTMPEYLFEANLEKALFRLQFGYFGYLGYGEAGYKSDLHGVMLVRDVKTINLFDFKESLVYKEEPSEAWTFESPESIHLAPDETLLVADSFNHRIVNLKQDGTIIRSFGHFSDSKYSPDSIVEVKQRSPSSIVFATDGTLFANDPGNKRIQHFKMDGTLIGTSWSQGCSLGSTLICGSIDMFASVDVYTKVGTKFSIDQFPGVIRKYIPISADYIYYGGSALGKNFAVFENITVSNEHYWVQLQDQGGYQFKVLKAYPIKPAVENNTSVYNPFTGLLTLPKVTADGVNYQVVMQRLDNGLFGVKSAALLPK